MSESLPRHGRTVKPNPAARRKARHFAMQALYQWAMAGASLNDIEVQFVVDNDMKGTDMEYFRELFRGVPRNVSTIDGHLLPLLDREIKDVTPVE
jgi:transcription antitermination protein NusB